MLCQSAIIHLVDFVQHKVQQVKSRDEGRWEINVGRDGQFGIIARVDGVRSGQDGCSGVERSDDACFGNGDGLLFLSSQQVALGTVIRNKQTITSCKTDRVASDILSNSSIQHTPPSERTRAPLNGSAQFQYLCEQPTHLSRTSCLESGSLVT